MARNTTNKDSADVGTMDESVEAAAVPGQHNEEDVEAEVVTEGFSGYPEY